ncbi:MAG: formylglycine-generating enzyme family protein, partial [Pyrinomonadaceae bacterium]
MKSNRSHLIALIVAVLAFDLCAGTFALAQTTPGQSPTNNASPPPAKKKKPAPAAPTRTPSKRTGATQANGSSTAAADERTFWESIQDSKNAADFRAYLDTYGEKGKFAKLAHNRLTEIETANKPADTKSPTTVSSPGGPTNPPATVGNSGAPTNPPTVPLAKPAAGTRFRTPQGIDLVYVPAGSFDRGSTHYENEKTFHRVTISQGFYLGKTEVTQAQWKAVMGMNPSNFKGDDLPVEKVSWDDATEFIRLLNAQSGGVVYRLPTEAEWEYACRAGTIGPYAGDLDAMAWYDATFGKTHSVGQKQPNAWGLYDMHGNVWEWVQDRYDAYSDEAQTDPKGPSSGSVRVFRGGGFNDIATYLRSAYRSYNPPGDRSLNLGFRLAMTAEPGVSNSASEKPVAPVVEQPAAGTSWRSSQGIDFLFIPSGNFMMGSNGSETGRVDTEGPQHKVTISQGFYLGKYEVTQSQWQAVMGTTITQQRDKNHPDQTLVGEGGSYPMYYVTWDEVQEFITRLNMSKDGFTYRLPTEAEWEYAARSGTSGPYSGTLDAMAWYANNAGNSLLDADM